MMHIQPAIPEWEELEEYLNERDRQHGHEVALTDYGLMCTAMDIGGVKELWLVKWHKTDWREFDWDDLPEDLQQTLRALANPNANDWICPDEDFPNIVSLNIAEPTFEKSIASMKQSLRLLDYGWILAEPRYAPCIWGEKEWDDTPASIDVKEDLEWFYPEGYFLFQRIVNGEKLPAKIDWPLLTQGEDWLNWRWGYILEKRPDFADFCPWDKLTPCGWASILEKSPQFAQRCDWSIFQGAGHSELPSIFRTQPQLLELCPAELLTAEDQAEILAEQPQLESRFDFSRFDDNAWGILLNRQPQFARKCDWDSLTGRSYDSIFLDVGNNYFVNDELLQYADPAKFSRELWSVLLSEHPELAPQCRCWKHFRDYEWQKLLLRQPQFAENCNWKKLSGETMFRILLKHPQLAEYCDFSKLKSRELCLLHHDFPEMRFEHIGDK